MKTILLSAAIVLLSIPAFADVTVNFDEGAPKDRFTIKNEGTCPLGAATVVLDLGASAAGLIFDVTGKGAGVSVFQPLELVAGREFLTSVPEVRDGDNTISLPINTLAPGQSITFTIDVDDTKGTSATMVSGAEIRGAEVRLDTNAVQAKASFTDQAVARVAYIGCNT